MYAYRGDNETLESNAALTTDGGLTWELVDEAVNPGQFFFQINLIIVSR